MFRTLFDIPSYFQLSNELGRYNEDDFHFDGEWIYHEDNKFHYLEKGQGKQTILLLHGIMVTSNIWKNYLEHFSEKYKVYAIDFLGHGLSTKKEDLNIEDLVKQIDIFIQKKNIKNPIIIGHSLGGLVASIYASHHQENISRLVLISCGEYQSITNNFLTQFNSQFLDLGFSLINQFTFPMFLQFLGQRVYNHPINLIDDSKSEILYHFKLKGSKKALFSLMKNYNFKNFSIENYERITCPTLVIHGEKDRIVEYFHAEKLAQLVPQSQLEMIPGGSHMIIEENEFAVRSLMEKFIESEKKPDGMKDFSSSIQ